MLLKSVLLSVLTVLVAGQNLYHILNIRDAIAEAELEYIEARNEYIEQSRLFRRLGGMGICATPGGESVCLSTVTWTPCGKCPLDAHPSDPCMCDANSGDKNSGTRPTTPTGGSPKPADNSPAAKDPKTPSPKPAEAEPTTSQGKCRPLVGAAHLHCTEMGGDKKYNTRCQNSCGENGVLNAPCTCIRTAKSRKRTNSGNKRERDEDSNSVSPESPTKKRKGTISKSKA